MNEQINQWAGQGRLGLWERLPVDGGGSNSNA